MTAAPVEVPSDALSRLIAEHEDWLAVERGLAPNSRAAYRRDLRRYVRFLRERGDTDPAAIGEPTVQDYVRYLGALRDEDGRPLLAAASIARALVAVRSFHGFCATEGLLPTDPSEDVDAPRVPQGIPKALDELQVEQLLGAVTGDGPLPQRDRALLETLYATGIRISEAVGLELGDLDLQDGVVRVLGKGDKERIVPIGRSARRVVGSYLRDGRLVLRSARIAASGRQRRGVPQRARRPDQPAGVLVDRSQRGRAGRARRSPVAARAPSLVRDAHARPGRRPARRAGAARPRQHLDHPGVHEGLAGAAAGGLRRGPPEGQERRIGGEPVAIRRFQCGSAGVPSAHVRCGRGGTTRGAFSRAGTGYARARDHRDRQRANDSGFADSGQVTAERGEIDALVGSLRDTLSDIDDALAKIDAGTYGVCEQCSEAIGDARLEAMPAARLCIACASARR